MSIIVVADACQTLLLTQTYRHLELLDFQIFMAVARLHQYYLRALVDLEQKPCQLALQLFSLKCLVAVAVVAHQVAPTVVAVAVAVVILKELLL
jgi:hypothetical protein